jgi:hypothetical protein
VQRPCPSLGDVDRTLQPGGPVLVTAAMKLVRISAFAFVALSAACASKPSPPVASPVVTDAVSTTRVNAASIHVSEEEATPRVGKAQRSEDAASEESLDSPKDEPRRSEGRRSWK